MELSELVQFGFLTSIIYILYVIVNISLKVYGRFKLQAETKILMSNGEKILLLLSIAYFFTYII